MVIFLLAVLIACIALILYVYFGYPLFIVALSRLRPRPIQKAEHTPSVAMLVPAFNEEAVIADKLDNALSLDYPADKLTIIAIDDASDDRTPEIVAEYAKNPQVEVNTAPARSGKIGGLNRVIPTVQQEITLISDADIIIDGEALKRMMSNFADESVGCVVGQTVMMPSESTTGESGGLYWKYEALIRRSETKVHSMIGATGHLMAVRSDLLDPLPPDIIVDDFYIAMMVLKQGYRVAFEPEAVCYEKPTFSMQDEVKRRRRMTAGRYQAIFVGNRYLPQFSPLLILMVVSHKFMRLGIPIFMIGAFVANLALVVGLRLGLSASPLLTTLIDVVFAAQAAFYLLALLGKLTDGTRFKNKLFSIAYYLFETNFASLRGLFWYLSGERTVLWDQAARQSEA